MGALATRGLLRCDKMAKRDGQKHAACFARRVKFAAQKYISFRK
jgi:hypothetical protein